MNRLAPPAHRLTAGRVLYLGFYKPAHRLTALFRQGGPGSHWLDARGERRMCRAAQRLSAVPDPGGKNVCELHVLTGTRHWHQTAFSLWSFARHVSERRIVPVIYDDGSLTDVQQEALHRIFPLSRYVSYAEACAKVASELPESRYPCLRERWQNYPNIRKLIDPHLAHAGWRLVVDSDLLFFRRPDFLLNWLDRPDRPLHAVDCTESYGYSSPLLQRLAGAPLPRNVNVGLCGLDGAALDWDRLEYWCRTLIQQEGTHYYLEQALVALLLAGRDCAVAPANEYVTLPDEREAQACTAVMHHYVAESKRWYFRHNWRRCLPLP